MINACNKTWHKIMVALGVILFLIIPFLAAATHGTPHTNHSFPKTVAWQLNANKSSAVQLAKFDVVILQMNAQNTNPNLFSELRRLNPDIVILAYTTPVEYPKYQLRTFEPTGRGLWHDLSKLVDETWVMKTYQGKEVSFWQGNVLMNLSLPNQSGQTYANTLADFLSNRVLSTGLWDGLIFDTVHHDISWLSTDIDVDLDGKKDSVKDIDQAWYKGMDQLFSRLRLRAGDDFLLITNGNGEYQHVNNGRMFENYPALWDGWANATNRYFVTDRNGFDPRFNIVNSDTDNTGDFKNYSLMRYGLTSTLLANGYYNFDFGDRDRSFTPYYDEFAIDLGSPVTAGFNLLSPNNFELQEGIWQREFEHGVSIVNSSGSTRKITFDQAYEKLHGRQDPYANSGRQVQSVTISPRDGIILLRPLTDVLENIYENGNYTRVFELDGKISRTSYFANDKRFEGNLNLVKADLDNDNRLETIAIRGGEVTIYEDNGAKRFSFLPFDASTIGDVSLAFADINNDGVKEIIAGAGSGMSPVVKVFNNRGEYLGISFYAYVKNFSGGVKVATGDLDGNGSVKIITGPGYGGGPHIRVFNTNGTFTGNEWFAYNPAFRGGTYVAVGDVNGDGKDEIITGAGRTGGPHVKVYTKEGKLIKEFFAFTAQSNQGVRVGAHDIDDDGKDEILTMTNDFFIFR